MKADFRVVTYNIHRGLSAFRKANVVDRVAAVLAASEADAVCVQEAWGLPHEKETELDRLSRDHWAYRCYGKNVAFPEGHQGNLILSRFPIRDWGNIDLSADGCEPRGCLWAEMTDPRSGREFFLMSQHFGLDKIERARHVRKLAEGLPERVTSRTPIVMAGDFNDWRSLTTQAFARKFGLAEAHAAVHGRSGRSYPSLWPVLPLDRIYYRGFEAVSAAVLKGHPFRGLSDHLPVQASFRWA